MQLLGDTRLSRVRSVRVVRLLVTFDEVLFQTALPQCLVYATDLRYETVPELIELFVVVANPFFTVRVELFVCTVSPRDFVSERVAIVAQDVLKSFERI